MRARGIRGIGWAAAAIAAAAAAPLVLPRPCGPASARDGSRDPAPPRAYAPLLVTSPVTVARGVHLLGAVSPNAAYAIETSDGIVLVDTCKEADAGPVIRQLRALGLDPARVRRILLTHAHGDHSIGAGHLRRTTGALVHAGAGDCEVLRAGGPREAFCSFFEMEAEPRATPVDVELRGGETLVQGDTRIEVVAAPGHTPGSVCYLLERDGARILFTGDVVMSLTDRGRFTGAGIYPAYLSPRFRGDAARSLATLRRLLAMPAPDLVLPGHPGADPDPQSPRIPREEWEALLGRAVRKLEALVERRASDGADYLDGNPKELLPGLHYLGDYGGRASYALVAPGRRLLLLDAPGGAGFLTFLSARLKSAGLEGLVPSAVLLTSSAPEASRGLPALVKETGCEVVAPWDGVARLAEKCPEGTRFRPVEDLAAVVGLPVEVVRTGSGDAVAYSFPWSGKRVVATGAVPRLFVQEPPPDLLGALPKGPDGADPWRRFLDRLGEIRPDLWLPAVPVHDQSANLYDTEWADLLRSHRSLCE